MYVKQTVTDKLWSLKIINSVSFWAFSNMK